MATLTFRRATLDDAARLADLMVRSFRETYSRAHHGECRVEDVEAYVAEHFGDAIQRAELCDPALATVLAEHGDALAGYAQLRVGAPCPAREGPRPVEIARFYVDRPWHGQGVAWALMRECVARGADADPLWLGVFQRNARAIAFYEKCGFERAGTARFVMGDDVQDDWILVRPLETLLTLRPPSR